MESVIRPNPNETKSPMLSVVIEQTGEVGDSPEHRRTDRNLLKESTNSNNHMLLTNLSLDCGMIRSITFT